jgi:hypothetical protein
MILITLDKSNNIFELVLLLVCNGMVLVLVCNGIGIGIGNA